MKSSKSPARRLRAAACAALPLALGALSAQAETLVGLTGNNTLVTFDSAAAGSTGTPVAVTGLNAGQRLVALDLRPTTGVLYGLSSDNAVYSLALSGAASFVSALSTPLVGDAVGFDFNPMADLAGLTSLRIVSSSGQNFAFNVATGATTVATAVQPGFSAVAYNNVDLNPATATSLYYIDAAADLLKVAGANFNAPTIATVGALGVDAGNVAAFDISSSGAAFAVLAGAGGASSGLYAINLATGAASLLGAVGGSSFGTPLVGLTAITAPVPEPSTYALMLAGLGALGWMARRRQIAPRA